MPRLLAATIAFAAFFSEVFVLAVYAPTRVSAVSDSVAPVAQFAGGAAVSQTFIVNEDGFERVEVMFLADRAAEATVNWQLLAVPEDRPSAPVAYGTARLHVERGRSWQHFRFTRRASSAGRRYRFQLVLNGEPQPAGAAVSPANALDNPYRGGYLAVDGTPHWGDMVFVSRSQGDTIAGRFRLLVMPDARPPFNHLAVWISLLLILNVLVAITVAAMLVPAR